MRCPNKRPVAFPSAHGAACRRDLKRDHPCSPGRLDRPRVLDFPGRGIARFAPWVCADPAQPYDRGRARKRRRLHRVLLIS